MDNPNIQTFREYVICARNNALAFLRDFSARKVFHDMYVVHTFFLALQRFHEFFFYIFTTLSVCYSKESRRWLSKRFLSVIWQKCRQITILSINTSIWLIIKLKITPDCQQQVAWGVIYFLITKKSQILLEKGHRASTFII